MAPKKKSGGGKGKGGTGGVVDGVSTTEMTREQLEQHAIRLRDEMEREREERNFFQLERDKLRTFWEITRQQLDENRAELRNKDREMEEKEDKHKDEIKIFKQKVKHLLYEQQNSLAELRAENMVSLKMAQDDFNEQELTLLKDKKGLKDTLQEQQREHQEEMKALCLKHSEELSKARTDFENQARSIETKYEKRMSTLRSELGLRHVVELGEVEERKNKQISDLMKNHEKAFAEMKNYYNDITLNNLALVASLKEQMEEMKRREERMEKTLKEVQKENKNLVGPMQKAKEESVELSRQLTNYNKDKISLANTKRTLVAAQRELENLKSENQVLELRFEKIEQERDDLRDRFVAAVLEVQQKSGLRSVMLEKKLRALSELLEQREAQFAEVLAASRLDPHALSAINNKVEELLSRKNAAIQDLEYELARVCKAHDDLVQTYEGKLAQYGVPKEELGFTPLKTNVSIGKGPAGLITLNK